MDTLLCYHVLLIFVATVSLALLWVGFATPGWFVVTFQENTARNAHTVSSLNRSLFYDVHCPQELQTCKTCMLGDDPECKTDMFADGKMRGALLKNTASTLDTSYVSHYNWVNTVIAQKEEWDAWRIIMTIVVVVAFIGFIFVIVLVCCLLRRFVYRIIAICGFFCWLIAGLLVWIPVGMVADLHLEYDDEITDNDPHDATLHIPYSLVIAAVGGFIALVTALMLLWLTGVCGSQEREYDSDSRSSIEIYSDRPKSHMIVREEPYYGQYPYYQTEVADYDNNYRPTYVQTQRAPSEMVTVMQDSEPAYQYYGPARKWYDNRY